jgi:hypothetical protein
MSEPIYPHAKNEYEFMPDGSVRITLTCGHLAYVDAEDFATVAPYRWQSYTRGKNVAARHGHNEHGKVKTLYMHQILMPDGPADHVDCNGLNNRRSNLRYVTRQQNQRNRRKIAPALSRYKGVCPDYRRKNPWRASINISRRGIYIGSFSTEEEAARAYDVAARQHFGEHARLNFPESGEQSAID